MEKEGLSGEEKVKERIKFYIEVLRLAIVAILAIGGGTTSLVEQDTFSGKRNLLIAIGFVLMISLIIIIYSLVKNLNKLMR